jgi:hypothetical protein
MNSKYRGNLVLGVDSDTIIAQFIQFLTSPDTNVTVTDVDGNAYDVETLSQIAAGTMAPSAIVALNQDVEDALATSQAVSGQVSTLTQTVDAISARVDTVSGEAVNANANALGASGYADTAYTAALEAQSSAQSASAYAGSAYILAEEASSQALGASAYADTAYTSALQAKSDAQGASAYAGSGYLLAQQAESDAQGASAYADSAYSLAASAMSLAEASSGGSGGAGLVWNYVTGNFTPAVNNGYFSDSGDRVAVGKLPVRLVVGDRFQFYCKSGQLVIDPGTLTIGSAGAGIAVTLDPGESVTLVADTTTTLEVVNALTGTASTASLFMAASDTVFTTAISENQTIPYCDEGDLLLAFIMHRDTLTPPAGWTLVDMVGPFTSGTFTQYTSVYKRIAVAGDTGTVTTWTAATSQRIAVHIHSYRKNGGCDVLATTKDTVSNTAGNSIAFTTPVATESKQMFCSAGSAIIADSGASSSASVSAGWTITTPTYTTDTSNQIRLSVAYEQASAPGAITGTFGNDSSNASSNGWGVVNVLIG